MHHHIIPDVVTSRHVCRQPPTSTAFDAAREMVDCDVAGIVVLDDRGRLLGIVTERDLTRKVMGEGLNPKKTTLAQVMTANPETLAPDDLAITALKMMRQSNYRHLPVVDGNGRVISMVSIRDLYAAVTTELEEDIHETEAFVFGDRYGA